MVYIVSLALTVSRIPLPFLPKADSAGSYSFENIELEALIISPKVTESVQIAQSSSLFEDALRLAHHRSGCVDPILGKA